MIVTDRFLCRVNNSNFLHDEVTTYSLQYQSDGNLCVHAINAKPESGLPSGLDAMSLSRLASKNNLPCWCAKDGTKNQCKQSLPGLVKLDKTGDLVRY